MSTEDWRWSGQLVLSSPITPAAARRLLAIVVPRLVPYLMCVAGLSGVLSTLGLLVPAAPSNRRRRRRREAEAVLPRAVSMLGGTLSSVAWSGAAVLLLGVCLVPLSSVHPRTVDYIRVRSGRLRPHNLSIDPTEIPPR
jgi:hypothetical protein